MENIALDESCGLFTTDIHIDVAGYRIPRMVVYGGFGTQGYATF